MHDLSVNNQISAIPVLQQTEFVIGFNALKYRLLQSYMYIGQYFKKYSYKLIFDFFEADFGNNVLI